MIRRLFLILLITVAISTACTAKQAQKALQDFYTPYSGLEEPTYIPGGPTLNQQAVQLEKLRVARERKYGITIKDPER